LKKRKHVKKMNKQKHSKKLCHFCKKNYAEYILMSSNRKKYLYCYQCVPKGCSCTQESIYFDESLSEEEQKEFKQEQLDKYINDINNGFNYKVYKYIQNDKNEIDLSKDAIKKYLKKEEILDLLKDTRTNVYDLIFIPLDENQQEYPCCEFFYDKNSFRV